MLVIDTVIGNKDYYIDILTFNGNTETTTSARFAYDSSYLGYIGNTYPQLTEAIAVNQKTHLSLPLDNKGGTFVIKNITHSDTLRILKWEILVNNLPDTVTQYISYDKMINDSIIEGTTKTKFKTEYLGSSNNSRTKLAITVNGKAYSIPLRIDPQESYEGGHGYTPSRKRDKFLKLDNNGQLGKKRFKYSKFYYRSFSRGYVYRGELTL